MAGIRDDFSVQALGQGLLVALVGYASSVAILIQGLVAVGASVRRSPPRWSMIGIAQGRRGDRAELVAAHADLDRVEHAGHGAARDHRRGRGRISRRGRGVHRGRRAHHADRLWTPLGRLVAAIPKPIASAMLAGILLKLCLAPSWRSARRRGSRRGAGHMARVHAFRARLCGAGRRHRRAASRWHSTRRSPAWRAATSSRTLNSSCRSSPGRRWSTSRCRCSS